MEITNLTQHQVDLLDAMWAQDTYDEYQQFLESLTAEDRAEAERLQTLVLIEALDEDMKEMCEYPAARRVLLDIMYK